MAAARVSAVWAGVCNEQCDGLFAPRAANRLSHGLGLVLGILGLVLLLNKGWAQGPQALVSYSLYGGSLVLLYLASTLYHSMAEGPARRWCKVFDHCAIYLLIAGTYTPFLLVALDTPLAQGLMVVIWGLALAGWCSSCSSSTASRSCRCLPT